MTFYRRLRTCWQIFVRPKRAEWWGIWNSHLQEERIALGEENIMLWKDNDYLTKTISYYLDKLEEIMDDHYREHRELEDLKGNPNKALALSIGMTLRSRKL